MDDAKQNGGPGAEPKAGISGWLQELRRRHIFKVTIAYLVLAWLLMQVASVLESSLKLPDWTDKLTFAILVIGFPIALFVTWAVDLTPQIKEASAIPETGAAPLSSGSSNTVLKPDETENRKVEIAPENASLNARVSKLREVDIMFQRPVVAVLPFENMSGDPEQEFFVDGLTEDLITALSLWRSFPVIARNSTFAFKGQSPDIREVGRQLGAKFVIEGSVRKVGDRVRITAQLINSETGHHVWAERFDRDFADIFQVQDEISQRIAATVAPELDFSIPAQTHSHTAANLDAWELVQRGFSLVLNFNMAELYQGRSFLEQAIKLDPKYARGYIGLGWSYHRELWLDRKKATQEARKRFLEIAYRAIDLDDQDSDGHTLLAFALYWMGDYDRGIRAAQRALAINPNNAASYHIMGHGFSLVGNPAEAIVNIEKALFLSPRDPRHGVWYWGAGLACLTAHKYEDAVRWSEQAIQRHSNNPDAHLVLASALGHLGRVDEGRKSFETFRRLLPIQQTQPSLLWPYKNEADEEHFLEGLRKVGLSDNA